MTTEEQTSNLKLITGAVTVILAMIAWMFSLVIESQQENRTDISANSGRLSALEAKHELMEK